MSLISESEKIEAVDSDDEDELDDGGVIETLDFLNGENDDSDDNSDDEEDEPAPNGPLEVDMIASFIERELKLGQQSEGPDESDISDVSF